MRPPFFMDDLRPDDQRAARRWFFGILFAYTGIVVVGFAIGVACRGWLDNHADAPCAAAHVGLGDCRQALDTHVLPGRSMASS